MVVGFYWSFNYRNGLTVRAAVAEKDNVSYQGDGLFERSIVEINKDHLTMVNILNAIPRFLCSRQWSFTDGPIKSTMGIARGKRLYSLNAINAP